MYNAMTVSLDSALSSLTMDVNYTYSHSLDDSSGLQSDFGFGSQNNSGPFIENPIRQQPTTATPTSTSGTLSMLQPCGQMPFGKAEPS